MPKEKPPAATELSSFIARLPRGGQSRIADALGLTVQHVSKFKSGALVPMLRSAVELEALTSGVIEAEGWLTAEEQSRVGELAAQGAREFQTADTRVALRRSFRRALRDLRRAADALAAEDPETRVQLRAVLEQLSTKVDALDD